MGVVLGSGYSQVPLVLESAHATLARTAIEDIKAQREKRRDSILEIIEDLLMEEDSHRKIVESDPNVSTKTVLTCEAELLPEGFRPPGLGGSV